jgi:hypothetical protein
MSSATGSCLASGAIFDADIVRRLWHFYEPDGISFKNFSKTIRGARPNDLEQFLRPYLHQLPALVGVDGKPKKKAKRKAALLILSESDLEILQDTFDSNWKTTNDIKRFLRRSPPEIVLRCFKTAAHSEISGLPVRLQALLRIRGSELESISTAAVSTGTSLSSDLDQVKAKNTSNHKLTSIKQLVDQVEESERVPIINAYRQALYDGRTQTKAFRIAVRAAQKVKEPTAKQEDVRKAYLSPCSPELHAPNSSIDAAHSGPSDAENNVKESKKRKRSSMNDTGTGKRPVPAKKKKASVPLAVDGHQDTYDIPISSSSSQSSERIIGQEADSLDTKEIARPPSSQHPNKSKSILSSGQTRGMSEAERQLLAETLNLTARKNLNVSIKFPEPDQESVESPTGTLETTSVVSQTMLKSTKPQTQEGDLLMESLKFTARPKAQNLLKGQHKASDFQSSSSGQFPSLADHDRHEKTKSARKKEKGSKARESDKSEQSQTTQNVHNPTETPKQNTLALDDKGNGFATIVLDTGRVAKRKLEDDFLLQCLATTTKKSSPNADDGSSARSTKVAILPSTERSNSLIPNRSASTELGDDTFSPPAKRAKKRKRFSSIPQPRVAIA